MNGASSAAAIGTTRPLGWRPSAAATPVPAPTATSASAPLILSYRPDDWRLLGAPQGVPPLSARKGGKIFWKNRYNEIRYNLPKRRYNEGLYSTM